MEPEGGAGDQLAAVVVIPVRRDNPEAGQFAPEPNVLIAGSRAKMRVLPEIVRRPANRPIERSEECPPGQHAHPGQHPVPRSAEEHSIQNGGLPPPLGAMV